jgi:hypothetical protein
MIVEACTCDSLRHWGANLLVRRETFQSYERLLESTHLIIELGVMVPQTSVEEIDSCLPSTYYQLLGQGCSGTES